MLVCLFLSLAVRGLNNILATLRVNELDMPMLTGLSAIGESQQYCCMKGGMAYSGCCKKCRTSRTFPKINDLIRNWAEFIDCLSSLGLIHLLFA